MRGVDITDTTLIYLRLEWLDCCKLTTNGPVRFQYVFSPFSEFINHYIILANHYHYNIIVITLYGSYYKHYSYYSY